MTSTRLQILERQLGRASGGSLETSDVNSKVMISYKEQVDRDCKATVKAAEDRMHKVEADNAALVSQLADLNREAAMRQKDLLHKLEDAKDVAKQELESLCLKHAGEMDGMRSQISALLGQVATERQDKVRAQAKAESAEASCINLERMVTKLQDVKPVAAPAPAAPPKPVSFTSKVSQRDENGRIVSMTTTPNF